MSFVVTREWIMLNASYVGPGGNAWKQQQKDILNVGSARGWIDRAVGSEISDDNRKKFESMKGSSKKKNKRRMTQDEIDASHNSEPDWEGECSSCGQSPTVPETGMCGPCTFGEADTVGGNW